jgi:hypothetical protein
VKHAVPYHRRTFTFATIISLAGFGQAMELQPVAENAAAPTAAAAASGGVLGGVPAPDAETAGEDGALNRPNLLTSSGAGDGI